MSIKTFDHVAIEMRSSTCCTQLKLEGPHPNTEQCNKPPNDSAGFVALDTSAHWALPLCQCECKLADYLPFSAIANR